MDELIEQLPPMVNFDKLNSELKAIEPSIELTYSEKEDGTPGKLIVHEKGLDKTKMAAILAAIAAHDGAPEVKLTLEERVLALEQQVAALIPK